MTDTKQDERQMVDWDLVTELFLRRYPPPISCLVCGQKGELAICHSPSGAWVCKTCRDAGQARAEQRPASGELRAAWKTIETFISDTMPPHPHKGSCGPESGCDATCMDIATISEALRIVRKAAFDPPAAKKEE